MEEDNLKTYKLFEVAKMLRISMPTLLKIIKNKEIKVLKVGGSKRVVHKEIENFLDRREK